MDKTKTVRNPIKVSIRFVMIFSVFLIVITWFFAGYVSRRQYEGAITMSDGWSVSILGQTHQNVVLQELKFNGLKKGESVDLYYNLDDRFDSTMVIEYLTYLASVEAWVGDIKVYSEGVEAFESGKFVGSGYHRIPLTENCSGQTLHIRTVANSYNAFTNIQDPVAAPAGLMYKLFCRKNFVGIFSDIFLVVLGIIGIVVGIPSAFYSRHYFRLIFVGLFSFLVGIYSLCSNKILSIFTDNLSTPTQIEYVALYLAPVAIGFLIWDMRREGNRRNATIILIANICLLVFDIVAFMLHLAKVVMLPQTLTVFHIFAFVIFGCFVYYGLILVKNKTRADKVTTTGTFILSVAIILDLARFNIQKYIAPGATVLLNSFLPVGTLIFVCFLIVSYIFYMYDMVLSNAEKQSLVKLAYNDQLTGLLNRAKYNEIAEELGESDKNFGLVNIDLNGLKQVNDQYGHLIGDNLLKEFALVLKECYGSIGKCFRVGGDEFLVILEGNKVDEMNEATKKLEEAEKVHSKKLDLTISCAYGLATREECNMGTVGEVYRLSDKRMYAMKEKMKAEQNNA